MSTAAGKARPAANKAQAEKKTTPARKAPVEKKPAPARKAQTVKKTPARKPSRKEVKASKRRAARRRASAVKVMLAANTAAAGAAVLGTKLIAGAVVGRKNPLLDKLVSRGVGDVAPESSYAKHSMEVMAAVPSEEVSIVNAEGLTLKGHWVHCDAPVRVIIMVHGWHSHWTRDFGESVNWYRENGCELLYVEQRAHGDSEGKYVSYGIRERFDVVEWIDYARSLQPDLPLYLGGISMGASTVLMTAGQPISDKVTAVIADCGYTDASKVVRPGVEKVLKGAADAAMKVIDMDCRLGGGFTLGEYTTLQAMDANTDVPVLFIHGDADHFVPLSMTLENYMACRAPKELLIVHGAAHGLSYIVDPDTYKARVAAFFEAWDGRLKA